jgi:hypothetical protein
MRFARSAVILLLLSCLYLQAESKAAKLSVVGKLTRAMAIGGESSGWSIELDSETTIDGKALHSVEIDYADKAKLEQLANQHVRAKGIVTHRQGVETGDRTTSPRAMIVTFCFRGSSTEGRQTRRSGGRTLTALRRSKSAMVSLIRMRSAPLMGNGCITSIGSGSAA